MGLAGALAVGSLALSGVSAVAQIRQADAIYEATQSAAQTNLQLQQQELLRQAQEVDEIAAEQMSDRIRAANRELGTLRAAFGEGNANLQTFARLVGDLAYYEGLDLSRIESNRKGKLGQLRAADDRARQEYVNTITGAKMERKATKTGALLGFAGSALQIGSDYYFRQQYLDLAKNKVR